MAKSTVFKARLKVVTVLVDRQLYGSEFHTEGELRLKDFADKVCALLNALGKLRSPTSSQHRIQGWPPTCKNMEKSGNLKVIKISH